MFLIEILIPILSILVSVAYYTLAERKIIAYIQRRKGPNIVGFWGLLQPIIDGLKAIFKEQIKPLRNLTYLFILAPFICFLISLTLLNFLSFSFTKGYFDEYLNMIFFLSISSFNVFGIIFAGWSSNSKYALLGGIRGVAQIFSFEMCFITILLPIFLLNSSFNILDIIILQKNYCNALLFFPSSIYFFIIILAETNRIPFDLPEAEAELVAGYNVEYSAINFAMFFLAEYTNMLINSFLYIFFFYGMEQKIISWNLKVSIFSYLKFIYFFTYTFFEYLLHLWRECHYGIKLSYIYPADSYYWINWDLSIDLSWILRNPNNPIIIFFYQKIWPCFFLSIKVVIIACLFILIRAILPRYRFDQLMNLCWKKILPVSFSFFLFYISAIYNFSGLLYNLEINLLGNPFFHIYIFSLT